MIPEQPRGPAPAVRAQLQRILDSTLFAKAERMSRFLRFIVAGALEGRGDRLKEYVLGVEVFDRQSSYDPRIDPIVRVEARRLRAKLKLYYDSEGREDPLVIDLPVGSYVPQFRRRSQLPEAAPAQSGNTIAVLPFTNLSADSENDYFSDGLTEELIHGLTKVETLRVVAWNSAAQLKSTTEDIQSIAERLKVRTILTGSVRRAGERLRVSVQLIEAASGIYLWSETYDRQLQDIFAIQDEISKAVVSTLKVKLRPPASSRSTGKIEAYNAYLKGRFHWNKRTPEGLEQSIQCFRDAIALDADFALAYAGLADAYSLQAEYGLVLPSVAMPQAERAAVTALERDPSLGEAHTSLGFIKTLYQWAWAEGEEHYLRAIAFNPGYATAHHWYGCDFLAFQGRFDEALAEWALARQLDPLSAIINESGAILLMLARRYNEALEASQKVLELDPHFYKSYTGMGRIYIQKGMYQEAERMLQKGRDLAGDIPNILGALGQAYALAGKTAEARHTLEELRRLLEKKYVASTCFALIHLGLGEKRAALEWLERAVSAGSSPWPGLKCTPPSTLCAASLDSPPC